MAIVIYLDIKYIFCIEWNLKAQETFNILDLILYSVAHQGLPRGGGANPPGVGGGGIGGAPTYDFAKFSQKTTWIWKNLDWGEGRVQNFTM